MARFQYQIKTEPVFIPTSVVVTDIKWFSPLSEPVRIKPRLLEGKQQFFTINVIPLVSFAWFGGLSEPKRFKPRLLEGGQQFSAFTWSPSTIKIDWFGSLSEPKRFKPKLLEGQQQFFSFQPTPVVSFAWFAGLSEPKRFKKRLPEGEHQFLAFTWAPSVISVRWFWWLSEPIVKEKRWLKPNRQQFLAAPPRLLPTPNVTGAMAATETKDIAQFIGRTYNAPFSAYLDMSEIVYTPIRAAIYEQVNVSATITLSEAAKPATANVSITETSS